MSTLDWDPPAFGTKEKCKVMKNTWPRSGMASSSMLERTISLQVLRVSDKGSSNGVGQA